MGQINGTDTNYSGYKWSILIIVALHSNLQLLLQCHSDNGIYYSSVIYSDNRICSCYSCAMEL